MVCVSNVMIGILVSFPFLVVLFRKWMQGPTKGSNNPKKLGIVSKNPDLTSLIM